jgi:hypothetical protein
MHAKVMVPDKTIKQFFKLSRSLALLVSYWETEKERKTDSMDTFEFSMY